MEHKDLTNQKVYETPLAEVFTPRLEQNFAGSNGETQNYDSKSIWDTGNDNE